MNMRGESKNDMSTEKKRAEGVVNHAVDRGFNILLLLLVITLSLSLVIKPIRENLFIVVIAPLIIFGLYVFLSILYKI